MRTILALLIVFAGAACGALLGLQLRLTGSGPGSGVELDTRADPGEAAGAEAGRGSDVIAGPAAQEHGGGDAHGTAAAIGGYYGGGDASDRDYVKLTRQIIVPVVHGRETQALMLFELALDVPRAANEHAYSAEPRLRDAFLRELMGMSYSGAFLTTYTDDRVIAELRDRLRTAARKILGDDVSDVLILDILRQEL